ncbi:hypothetical protein RSAG8_03866, partial [Rhizoctonia solani AG-8 WAC10335]
MVKLNGQLSKFLTIPSPIRRTKSIHSTRTYTSQISVLPGTNPTHTMFIQIKFGHTREVNSVEVVQQFS